MSWFQRRCDIIPRTPPGRCLLPSHCFSFFPSLVLGTNWINFIRYTVIYGPLLGDREREITGNIFLQNSQLELAPPNCDGMIITPNLGIKINETDSRRYMKCKIFSVLKRYCERLLRYFQKNHERAAIPTYKELPHGNDIKTPNPFHNLKKKKMVTGPPRPQILVTYR